MTVALLARAVKAKTIVSTISQPCLLKVYLLARQCSETCHMSSIIRIENSNQIAGTIIARLDQYGEFKLITARASTSLSDRGDIPSGWLAIR
jgi:hypothetical protein